MKPMVVLDQFSSQCTEKINESDQSFDNEGVPALMLLIDKRVNLFF